MNSNNRITHNKSFIWRLVILFALLNVTSQSFGQFKNEVSFYLQGSFSKLDYEVLGQDSGRENGFGLGTKYAYYLSENWSIGTGAEFQYVEGGVYLSGKESAYTSQDSEGENFEFRYLLEDFYENQYAYFLNVPIQIQYETRGMTRFYAAAGVKAGIVLTSEYETQIASLVTSGYYPQYDVELTDPEFAGFGEFGPINSSRSDLDLETNFILHLESGVKFMLENKKSLYMGLFLDYGLNNIQPDTSQERLLGYNNQNPTVFSTGSILSAMQDANTRSYIDEMRTMAFGLKIQYAFQF